MKRDNFDVRPVLIIGPAVLDSDNTPAAIEVGDAGTNEINISVGVGGITFTSSNKIEFIVTHGDTADGDFTAVESHDVILGENADASVGTGGIVKSFTAAHSAPSLTRVSYIGNKRYIKVLAKFSGTHGAGTPIAVTVVKSRLALAGKS